MSNKSLGNPYDSSVSLIHTKGCGCSSCQVATDEQSYSKALENSREHMAQTNAATDLQTAED